MKVVVTVVVPPEVSIVDALDNALDMAMLQEEEAKAKGELPRVTKWSMETEVSDLS